MPSKTIKKTPAKLATKKPVAVKVSRASKTVVPKAKAKPAVPKTKPKAVAPKAKAKVVATKAKAKPKAVVSKVKAKVVASKAKAKPVASKTKPKTATPAAKAKLVAKKAKPAASTKVATPAKVAAPAKSPAPSRSQQKSPSSPKAPSPIKVSKEHLRLPTTVLPTPLPPPPPVRVKAMVGAYQKLSDNDLRAIRISMIQERARLTGNVSELREQSLVRHDEVNTEEDGTDAFIRLQDLDRASSDQDIIAKIDSALRAINEGTYGLCERCSNRIESPRLRALPFVKTCIKCQAETEGGHHGKISVRHLLWE